MYKGVDVSYSNGQIDWNKAKNNIDFAIIRCGFGMDQKDQDDVQYKRNVEECIRLNIPFGVYLYSYANTVEKAKSEAEHVLRLLNPYKDKQKLNVWYDIEDKIQANLSKNELSNIITTFCNKIEAEGYSVGIYASNSWLRNKIASDLQNRYMIWSAGYGSNDGNAHEEAKYNHSNVRMWQYTSNGRIEGIGRCDVNYFYDEIPSNLPDLQYQVHLQDLGWQNVQNAGEGAGTEGQDRRLEAVKFFANNGLTIKYRAHVGEVGWQDWKNTGEIAGTTGESKRIEALEIKCNKLLEVQEHIQDVGWMPKTTAKEFTIGTVGKSLRMEAFRIKVIS